MPDTLALCPSSRMLGGTGSKKRQRSFPPTREPQLPELCLGRFSWPGQAAPDSGVPAPTLGPAHPGCTQALMLPSDNQFHKMPELRIHPVLHSTCCHGHLRGSQVRISEGGAWAVFVTNLPGKSLHGKPR